MARSLSVEIGTGRVGESGETTGPQTRVLQLSGQQIPPRFGGVVAIVDADGDEIDWICQALEAAFTVAILPGTEEDYVARVLARFDRHGVSIVLALWLEREVVVGSHHTGRVFLCQRRGCVDATAGAEWPESGGETRIARLAPSGGDALVLVSFDVTKHAGGDEVREALTPGFSSEYSANDAAMSLAAAAIARGGHHASVLVLQIKGRRGAARAPRKFGVRLPSGRTALRRALATGATAFRALAAGLPRPRMKRHPSATAAVKTEAGPAPAQVAPRRRTAWRAPALGSLTARRERRPRADKPPRKKRTALVPGPIAMRHGLLIGITAVLSFLVPIAALVLAWHAITSHPSSKRPVAVRIVTTPTPTVVPVTPTAVPPTPRPVIRHPTTTSVRLSPRPTPVPTARRVAPVKPQPSGPALESWKFPALPHASGVILLALYNPQTVPVVTDVRIPGANGVDSRRVRIPPKGTVRLQLSSQRGVPALTVQVSPPVVPARLVVG